VGGGSFVGSCGVARKRYNLGMRYEPRGLVVVTREAADWENKRVLRALKLERLRKAADRAAREAQV
jgi:hypothetical protein